MSTVPKLTYAKVGKGSKTKVEGASSELMRSKQQKSNDIFSQMNQQNLNYIKKQLKLKKTRSYHQRPRSPEPTGVDAARQQDQQVTQRYKLYQKYRGEEEVSEKQPHLQDTERISQQEKGLNILLPEDIQEDYSPQQNQSIEPQQPENRFISSSHHGLNAGKLFQKKQPAEKKMYQSLPYEDGKKRISSIEGYFGQAISTNLNRQQGQFIQFLQEYICDLNYSKNLKSRQNEEPSIEKQRNNGYQSQRKRTVSRQGSQRKYPIKYEEKLKDEKKKLDKLNRNNDTLGQYNSKYTMKSNISQHVDENAILLQQKYKKEKLENIVLVQQMQKIRQLIAIKDEIILKVETERDLFQEELVHLKRKQDIINYGKQSVPNLEYSNSQRQIYKANKAAQDDDQINFFQALGSIPHNRYSSNHHQKAAQSHRISQLNQNKDLFHNNKGDKVIHSIVSRQKKNRKDEESLEKWQKDYGSFLQQDSKIKMFREASRRGDRF